jgi:hypothetical protein
LGTSLHRTITSFVIEYLHGLIPPDSDNKSFVYHFPIKFIRTLMYCKLA